MKKILTLLLLCKFFVSYAIDANLVNSTVQNATSGLNLIYPTPSTQSMHPAVHTRGFETSATYLFGLKDLPYYNLHIAYNFGDLNLHLGNSYLDHNFYKENCLALSVAGKWDNLSLGFALRYLSYNVHSYENDKSIILDGSVLWSLESFQSVFTMKNLNRAEISNETLPNYYLWEMCYYVTKNSSLGLGLEKQKNYDFSFKLGVRQDIFSHLCLISGYQFNPDRLGIGVMFQISNINVSYSARTHQYLDLNHYISIGYEL